MKHVSETAMLQAETAQLRNIVIGAGGLNIRLSPPAKTEGNIGLAEMLDRAETQTGLTHGGTLPALGSILEDSAVYAQLKVLDPTLVIHSEWANRGEETFEGREWDDFKEEIRTSAGNKQPIKVRPVRSANALLQYEIVFGHRRHRACKELGLNVLSMVEAVNDTQLFEEMDRENRGRKNLSVYRQGESFRKALDRGMYPSIRKLSEVIGVAQGQACEALAVARLPALVLDAFESKDDIQLRWGPAVTKELAKNPDAVMSVAKTIQLEREEGGVIRSSEVFRRLTSIGVTRSEPESRSTELPGGRSMKVSIRGNSMKIEVSSIDVETAKLIEMAVVDAMKSRVES